MRVITSSPEPLVASKIFDKIDLLKCYMSLIPLNLFGFLSLLFAASSFNFSTGFEIKANVPYYCSIVTPTSFDFDVESSNINSVSKEATISYGQNGKSDFSISPVVLSAPSTSQVVASIFVGDQSLSGAARKLILQNDSSSSSSVSKTIKGNFAVVDHPITISLEEVLSPTLMAGTYEISSSISCSQSL